MSDVKGFFREIDRLWTPAKAEKIPLRVIGSGALLLQTDYVRGTKDGDVLESLALTEEIMAKLLKLAGKDSPLNERTRLYEISKAALWLPLGNKMKSEHQPLDIADRTIVNLPSDIGIIVQLRRKKFGLTQAMAAALPTWG
ncbi:MAG TPA: hypothetical protein VN915_06605 [Elusimicrobiota bacterium]|nr:hypothetical protein [Elusimicrobiota bacterium]